MKKKEMNKKDILSEEIKKHKELIWPILIGIGLMITQAFMEQQKTISPLPTGAKLHWPGTEIDGFITRPSLVYPIPSSFSQPDSQASSKMAQSEELLLD